MKSLSLIALALSSVSLFACVAADGEDLTGDDLIDDGADDSLEAEVKTGEVSQQLAAWGIVPYSCTGTGNYGSSCYFGLDTLTNRTCFLGGVSGDLRDGNVFVERLNGNWRLSITAGSGKTVSATAVCISGATNIQGGAWVAGSAASAIPGGTSKRRCFINGILNAGSTYNGMDNNGDYVKVWKDADGKWWTGGSISGEARTVVASICVDVPVYHSIWGIQGPASFPMAEGVTNVACGLTKIGGPFVASGDSVNISYNFGVHDWNISATAYNSGTADCVQ